MSSIALQSVETWKWLGILLVFALSGVFAAVSGYIRGKGVATLARSPHNEVLVFKKYMVTATICEYSTFFSPILGVFLMILKLKS